MSTKLIYVIVLASLISTFAQAQCYQVNFAPLGAKLEEEMTEAQVTQALGYTPVAVSLSTCGTESKGGEWQCKVETFGGICSGELLVFFRKNKDGIWVVNNWNATPPTGF